MSPTDDLISLAREHQDRNPDLAANAVRNALNFEPARADARELAARINPYVWTGFASMPASTIFLHEKDMPDAVVSAPTYYKLGLRPNDFLVHGNKLYFGYGTGNIPTHLVSFDSFGFSPLRQLPRGTQYLASNWEDNELIVVRDPRPEGAGVPLKFELDAVLFSTHNQTETIVGRHSREGQTTIIGSPQRFFYIDNETEAEQAIFGDCLFWEDFSTRILSSPIFIEPQISLPSHARYLRINRADHPGNTGALYATIHNDSSRIRRFSIEVPITLCDALRIEGERQRAQQLKGGLR